MLAPLPPFTAAAVLVGSHDGGVDHRALVVRLLSQSLENTPPHTASAPAYVAQVRHAKVAKALWQIHARGCRCGSGGAPHRRTAGCLGGSSNMPVPARPQVFDSGPLAICQSRFAMHASDDDASIEFDNGL